MNGFTVIETVGLLLKYSNEAYDFGPLTKLANTMIFDNEEIAQEYLFGYDKMTLYLGVLMTICVNHNWVEFFKDLTKLIKDTCIDISQDQIFEMYKKVKDALG